MSKQSGYYKVLLEHEGFATPQIIVYAASGAEAALKALEGVEVVYPGATVQDIEGPFTNSASIMMQ